MQPICIREFDFASDYERAMELWDHVEKGIHVGRSDSPAETQKKLERDPELFLVAEDGNELVGTVIGGLDGRRGIMYH